VKFEGTAEVALILAVTERTGGQLQWSSQICEQQNMENNGIL